MEGRKSKWMAKEEIPPADEMGKASYDLKGVYESCFNPLLVKYFSGIGS